MQGGGGYASFANAGGGDDQSRKRPADTAQPGDDKPFKKRWRGEFVFVGFSFLTGQLQPAKMRFSIVC